MTTKPYDADEFKKKVEESEKKYGITDCIYNQCLQEISRLEIDKIDENHEIRIFRPFLLTWGTMGRVLGYQGVTVICREIKGLSDEIEPLRRKGLSKIDLKEVKNLTIKLFDGISGIGFSSKKGKAKKVGPTAASKILHLICPDLFVLSPKETEKIISISWLTCKHYCWN